MWPLFSQSAAANNNSQQQAPPQQQFWAPAGRSDLFFAPSLTQQQRQPLASSHQQQQRGGSVGGEAHAQQQPSAFADGWAPPSAFAYSSAKDSFSPFGAAYQAPAFVTSSRQQKILQHFDVASERTPLSSGSSCSSCQAVPNEQHEQQHTQPQFHRAQQQLPQRTDAHFSQQHQIVPCQNGGGMAPFLSEPPSNVVSTGTFHPQHHHQLRAPLHQQLHICVQNEDESRCGSAVSMLSMSSMLSPSPCQQQFETAYSLSGVTSPLNNMMVCDDINDSGVCFKEFNDYSPQHAAQVENVRPSLTVGGRMKKDVSKPKRVLFTREQTNALEASFAGSPYPDIFVREQLGERIGLTERKIQVWFKNRRARDRKPT